MKIKLLVIACAMTCIANNSFASDDISVAYQCPKGWNPQFHGDIYCQNPSTGAVLMEVEPGKVISVHQGQRDKYCPEGWHVSGILVGC